MEPLKRTILAVDDELMILKLVKCKLEEEGFEVVPVETGQGCVDFLKTEESKRVHAVLLDLSLKDQNGFAVLEQIKEINSGLIVMIVTGSHDERDARKAIEMGAFDYVTKPIDFNRLVDILKR